MPSTRTPQQIRDELRQVRERRDRMQREALDLESRADDNGNLTGGDAQRWDNLTRGVANANEQYSRLHEEWSEAIERGIADGTLHTEPGTFRPPEDDHHADRGSTREAAKRNIGTAERDGLLPDFAAARAEKLVTDGPQVSRTIAARWAATTGDPHYLRAFSKHLADPTRGHLLWTEPERQSWQRVQEFASEVRAMSTGTNAGGEMIPLSLDPAILLTGDGSINPLRRISRVVQTTTNAWRGVSSAGATAEWKAEAAEVADGSPTLASPSIDVHFGDAFVPYSFEVGMDAAMFVNELAKVLTDAADQLQATAFTTGTGTGQPFGVVKALDGTSSEVDPASAESFGSGDVFATQNALPPRFQGRAQWCGALSTINEMAQMETTNGARLFPEIGDGRLLRRPLNELSNMRSVDDIDTGSTEDNHILLYGDFQHFVIADRIGSQLEIVPHLFHADNQRPTGQRGALLWFRTGSDVVVNEAFRVLNVATTA